MEKKRLLNQYDKEYMKMALLKHEETFREQVYELHRLYRIQKILMKDISKTTQIDPNYRSNTTPVMNRTESRKSLDSERAVESDLELTLGPRSYYERSIKGGEPGTRSDNSGPGFSSSSSGSSRGPRSVAKQEMLKWGPETPFSNQDRSLNSPPWLFQALSLNMTS